MYKFKKLNIDIQRVYTATVMSNLKYSDIEASEVAQVVVENERIISVPITLVSFHDILRFIDVPSKWISFRFVHGKLNNYGRTNAAVFDFDINAVKLLSTVSSVTKTTGVHATIFETTDEIPQNVINEMTHLANTYLMRKQIQIGLSCWNLNSEKIYGELADVIDGLRIIYNYVEDQCIPHIKLRE